MSREWPDDSGVILRRHDQPVEDGAVAHRPANKRPTMPNALTRILLIDEDIRQHSRFVQLLDQLAPHSYQLNWCSKLGGALGSMCANTYDIIFLGTSDDHLICRRLLREAMRQGCAAPVVVLCDTADQSVGEQLLAAGAADYIEHDQLNPELLKRIIRYLCNSDHISFHNHLSYFDPLTGIPNRLLFVDRLQQAIQRAERDRQTGALICFDIDGFKKVNESFGNDAGDQLIQMIAERLVACVRKTDSVARIGGDEFAVLFEEVEHMSTVVNLAEKLCIALQQSFNLGGHDIELEASIGIVAFPEAGREVDALLRCANLAKQQAKDQSGCTYRFYHEQMNADAMNQLYKEADLRRGLRRNEFELFYQPRINLASGRIVGMEGLIRWRHPVRGLVMPGDFIPLAEQMELIIPLGYWVVRKACADIQRMDELGLPPLDLALNLSFKQFKDKQFAENILTIIEESGVDARRLEFELTETTVMANAEETHQCMRSLSASGTSFSLDDFGTGYSSFAHIQRLPIQSLKVDRSFIQNVTANEDDAAIVKAMISLAHSLNLTVVAEGAEDSDQLQFLKNNQCDQVQGFYFSPPVTFEALINLIESDHRLAL